MCSHEVLDTIKVQVLGLQNGPHNIGPAHASQRGEVDDTGTIGHFWDQAEGECLQSNEIHAKHFGRRLGGRQTRDVSQAMNAIGQDLR